MTCCPMVFRARGTAAVGVDVVVPWHAARRRSGGRAPGAGRWSATFAAELGPSIPRGAFTPPPPGGVTVLALRRMPQNGRRRPV
jgi:hypothetical protein